MDTYYYNNSIMSMNKYNNHLGDERGTVCIANIIKLRVCIYFEH